MKLQGVGPSYLSGENATTQNKERDISWDREISREKARSILAKKMYPFKKVR